MTVTVMPWGVLMLLLSIFVRGAAVLAHHDVAAHGDLGRRVICGVRHRVHGMDNLPTAADRHAAVLLAAKHQSTWETFAFPTLMPHPLAYVFKRELLYIPFFGWAMGRLDMIHIDRSRRAEAWNKVAAQGKRLFAAGCVGDHVPRRHAHRARQPGCVQDRRVAAGHHGRRAHRADRRHVGALLAARSFLVRPA
jgi:1-acyl-sn-glycerol-3-phosphate acyltransferase